MSKNTLQKTLFDHPLPSLVGSFDDFFHAPQHLESYFDKSYDFEESDSEYTIELEVPGVDKKDIRIDLKNDLLAIRWTRKWEKKKLFGTSRYESSEESYSRSFAIPGADSDGIKAELKKGVLKINVPKRESYQPKRIEVN